MKSFNYDKITSTILMVLLLSFPTFAWNHGGHMATGAAAYKYLKQNSPSTIPKIIAILKKHPEFNRWTPQYQSVPAADQDLFLFMMAARWPDDARKTSYDHPEWHFCDHPVTFDSSPTQQPKPDNSVSEIEKNLAIVTDASADAGDRAVAMCWVFHLMGDLHQPLHNVTLFSSVFPDGDRGGNSFLIKDPSKELHGYWDGAFLSDRDVNYNQADWFANVNTAADAAIKKNPSVAFDKNITIDVSAISDEGVTIAQASVYKSKGTLLTPGVKGGAAGKKLPSTYGKDAKKICSKQVTLAGMRLAVSLSQKL
ncbi:MAG TPA: S1/P1 nuclease [Cyclobacteriaceae bacterium]|nr:S1/P1 nuclease [Cyclobacteriaceae bacterium]